MLMYFAFLFLMVVHAMTAPPPFNCTSQPEGTFDTYKLKNKNGMEAWFIRYGATLTHLLAPDVNGKMFDVVLGWDDATKYCSNTPHTYFGATIGRTANRIKNGTFEFDGKVYHTPRNEQNRDTLHGGWVGFDRRVWTVVQHDPQSITFVYYSPDGEEGYPGDVNMSVTHSLLDDNTWTLRYEATTNSQTIVAPTNHAYFNLNANIKNTPTVMEHEMTMPTGTSFIVVDDHLIPTGEIADIPAKAPWLDFRATKTIGKDIDHGTVTSKGGFDNAWLFAGWLPNNQEVVPRVSLRSPLTGIGLTMSTDQPSVQIYSGNALNGTDHSQRIQRKKSQSFGPDVQYYHWRGAVTLETQRYLDAVNHNTFPSWHLVQGQTYIHRTSFHFWAESPTL